MCNYWYFNDMFFDYLQYLDTLGKADQGIRPNAAFHVISCQLPCNISHTETTCKYDVESSLFLTRFLNSFPHVYLIMWVFGIKIVFGIKCHIHWWATIAMHINRDKGKLSKLTHLPILECCNTIHTYQIHFILEDILASKGWCRCHIVSF